MDFINKFFDFIIDNNRQLSVKALIIFGVLICLYLLNDVMGFTYYYNTKNKIEQVKAINEVLHDSTLSPEVRAQASSLRTRIFRRKNIFEKSLTYASTRYDSLRTYFASYTSKKVEKPGANPIIVASQPLPTRNNFLFLMSGAGVFVLLAVLMIPVSIYLGIEQGPVTGVSALILLVGAFGFITFTFYFILSLIPPIHGSWVWNYIINAIFQIAAVFVTMLYIARKNEQNAARKRFM